MNICKYKITSNSCVTSISAWSQILQLKVALKTQFQYYRNTIYLSYTVNIAMLYSPQAINQIINLSNKLFYSILWVTQHLITNPLNDNFFAIVKQIYRRSLITPFYFDIVEQTQRYVHSWYWHLTVDSCVKNDINTWSESENYYQWNSNI